MRVGLTTAVRDDTRFSLKLSDDLIRQDTLCKAMCSAAKWDRLSAAGDWIRK